MKKLYSVYVLNILVTTLFSGCFISKSTFESKGTEKKLTLLYFPNWTIFESAKIASFIKLEKNAGPTIVLIKHCQIIPPKYISTDTSKTVELTIKILELSNINGILLSSNLLNLGECFTEAVKKSNISWLGANVINKKTRQYVGQEYVIYNSSGLGIAVLGVSFDTINKNVQYRDPDFIILKLLPILKNRSDFQCLIANTDDTLNYPFDIILGAPSKNPLLANMFPVDKAHKIIISFDTTNKSFSINTQPINYSTVSEDQEIMNLKEEIATKYLVKQE